VFTRAEGHQNLDQASDQVERPALCRVIPPREEGCGCQKLGPQVPSSGSTKGGIRLRRKYKIPDHCLNRVFGHYGIAAAIREGSTEPSSSDEVIAVSIELLLADLKIHADAIREWLIS
jgi:hypothetical protein